MKLSLIIPFRDRLQHLSILLPYLHRCLNNIDYKIIVIEQKDENAFNKGMLYNIASLYSEDCDYFCLHDVDMIPIEYDYSYNEGVTQLATQVKQFDYKLPYENYFGGVLLCTKEDFKKTNGYSDIYWGWGAEDDDFYWRCLYNGVKISNRQCKYDSHDHERAKFNLQRNRNAMIYCRENPKVFSTMGLNRLEYKLINIEENTDFTLIQVETIKNLNDPEFEAKFKI